jgi:hypothetical protein
MKEKTEVWYLSIELQDGMPTLFETKLDAEKYAREMYGKEYPDTYQLIRLSRVYSIGE